MSILLSGESILLAACRLICLICLIITRSLISPSCRLAAFAARKGEGKMPSSSFTLDAQLRFHDKWLKIDLQVCVEWIVFKSDELDSEIFCGPSHMWLGGKKNCIAFSLLYYEMFLFWLLEYVHMNLLQHSSFIISRTTELLILFLFLNSSVSVLGTNC